MEQVMKDSVSRPGTVKAIFFLLVFKLLLAIVLFIVFTVNEISLGKAGPEIILYTFFAYLALSGLIFYFIHRRNALAVRIALVLDFLVSIPATAIAGFVISAIAFGLTFSKSAKKFWNA